jgi:hypothetical protein
MRALGVAGRIGFVELSADTGVDCDAYADGSLI